MNSTTKLVMVASTLLGFGCAQDHSPASAYYQSQEDAVLRAIFPATIGPAAAYIDSPPPPPPLNGDTSFQAAYQQQLQRELRASYSIIVSTHLRPRELNRGPTFSSWPTEIYASREFTPSSLSARAYRVVPFSKGQSWEIGPLGRSLQPQALLFTSYSRVYFNSNFTEALCYQYVGCLHSSMTWQCVIDSCEQECGGSFFIKARQQQGRWILTERRHVCLTQ